MSNKKVENAIQFWASTYPRRVTKRQYWATSITEATNLVLKAEDNPSNAPFISTYSFPRGHTSDGNIPRIDRLFFDFDILGDGNYRSGNGDVEAWKEDMDELLFRARKVAQFLKQSDKSDCWQAALSGHKGIHLDLVFPPVSPSIGNFKQFKLGMASYSNLIIDHISGVTKLDNLSEWFDVDSSDLARPRRVPNTKHLGASQSFGEDRFCVPVTLTELANITPESYVELTRSQRRVTRSMKATPNEKANTVLTQQIKTAKPGSGSGNGSQVSTGTTVDRSRIKQHKQNANDSITVSDIPFIVSKYPCVLEFVKRDDAFSHGSESHLMEMKVITHLIDENVPIQTIVDYINQHPEANESYTRERVEQYVSRSYNPVSCEKIWQKAKRYCLGDGCKIWINQMAKQNR
jgi:hypothetical protein